jgi:hypothetical protein
VFLLTAQDDDDLIALSHHVAVLHGADLDDRYRCRHAEYVIAELRQGTARARRIERFQTGRGRDRRSQRFDGLIELQRRPEVGRRKRQLRLQPLKLLLQLRLRLEHPLKTIGGHVQRLRMNRGQRDTDYA